MKRLIIITLFVLFGLSANSQQIKFGIKYGIGMYNFHDLKELTTDINYTLPFRTKIISNYPGYMYYEPGIYLSIQNLTLGIQTSFNSSGARISSQDYSGEYRFDAKIKSIAPGFYFSYTSYNDSEHIKVMISSEAGLVLSELDLTEFLTLYDESILSESHYFVSENFFIEPGINLEYQLQKYISIGLGTSIFIQFGKGDFLTSNNNNLYSKGEAVGPNWSGFRLVSSLVFSIPLK